METKELLNSAQESNVELEKLMQSEDSTQSKTISTENVEKKEHVHHVRKESAAEIILRKLAESKKRNEKNEEQPLIEPNQIIKEIEKVNPSIIENASIQEDIHVVEPESDIEETDELAEEETESTSNLINYNDFTKEELLKVLKEIIGSKSIQEIKNDVENIKTNFYKKLKAEIAETKRKFVEDGGDLTEFVVEPDSSEIEFKELYNKFKEIRNEYNAQIEKQKQNNLKAKYQIIEELKDLTNRKESLNQVFQEFKELQKRWREIGIVPQADVKQLWENYHYQIEKFYDFLNINKELRDLDLRKNLEAKIALCERAEELLLEPMVVVAFKALQKLHNQWRDIGPVPQEKKDELWERFKDATTKINKKHQDHFESLKTEQDNNLKAKTLLCEKAEELASANILQRKDWDKFSDEILELQKIWKLIGFAPKKDNNKIYSRFRNACDVFFSKKRDFFAQHKETLENNLQLKTDLCNQAESLIESTDWKKTTDIYINLQKQWKTIGPVPRKVSDAIWNRFRNACNAFFDKKANHFASIDAEQEKNLQLKRELIENIKNFEFTEDDEKNLDSLKEIQKRWTEIGHVPIQFKDEVQKQFREFINLQFNKLNADQQKNNELRFKTKLESLKGSPKANEKLRAEKEKLRTKIEQIQNDIVLWENNIGFFAKSKNAESMINEFNKKIESAKENVKMFKKQLDLMEKTEVK